MKASACVAAVLLFIGASSVHPQQSGEATRGNRVARVVLGDAPPVEVSELELAFSFTPIGIGPQLYDRRNYGASKSLPLMNGMVVEFDKIAEAVFAAAREQRGIAVEVKALDGTVVKSEVKEPGSASVSLIGKTALGSFKCDLYHGKTKVVFAETQVKDRLSEVKRRIDALTPQEKAELYRWLGELLRPKDKL